MPVQIENVQCMHARSMLTTREPNLDRSQGLFGFGGGEPPGPGNEVARGNRATAEDIKRHVNEEVTWLSLASLCLFVLFFAHLVFCLSLVMSPSLLNSVKWSTFISLNICIILYHRSFSLPVTWSSFHPLFFSGVGGRVRGGSTIPVCLSVCLSVRLSDGLSDWLFSSWPSPQLPACLLTSSPCCWIRGSFSRWRELLSTNSGKVGPLIGATCLTYAAESKDRKTDGQTDGRTADRRTGRQTDR